MAEKTVKARKKHKCDVCNKPIIKGDFYRYGKDRIPVYSGDPFLENQTGIQYISWKVCHKCDEEIKEGNYN